MIRSASHSDSIGGIRRKLVFAVAMIAMLAVPAYAQSQNSKDPPKSPQEIEAERAAEQAYKKSLSNIPNQPPADPWGNARSMDAPKIAAKTPQAKKSPVKPAGTPN
jgi:hypothetical protein